MNILYALATGIIMYSEESLPHTCSVEGEEGEAGWRGKSRHKCPDSVSSARHRLFRVCIQAHDQGPAHLPHLPPFESLSHCPTLGSLSLPALLPYNTALYHHLHFYILPPQLSCELITEGMNIPVTGCS